MSAIFMSLVWIIARVRTCRPPSLVWTPLKSCGRKWRCRFTVWPDSVKQALAHEQLTVWPKQNEHRTADRPVLLLRFLTSAVWLAAVGTRARPKRHPYQQEDGPSSASNTGWRPREANMLAFRFTEKMRIFAWVNRTRPDEQDYLIRTLRLRSVLPQSTLSLNSGLNSGFDRTTGWKLNWQWNSIRLCAHDTADTVLTYRNVLLPSKCTTNFKSIFQIPFAAVGSLKQDVNITLKG